MTSQESMATMRSPFCGYNTTWCVELYGEYLLCYSRNRKCPYDRWLTNKAYLRAVITTNISQSFTYKMAAKINWHRYGTKLRHCHPMYRSEGQMPRCSGRGWASLRGTDVRGQCPTFGGRAGDLRYSRATVREYAGMPAPVGLWQAWRRRLKIASERARARKNNSACNC